MDIDESLTPLVIGSFQLGSVSFPNGRTATDLFATGITKPGGPEQTSRLRLPPEVLAALVQDLSERATPDDPTRIQRLFHKASLMPAVIDRTNTPGFVLTLEQTNSDQGNARPVRMFLSQEQLTGLAELIREALEPSERPGVAH